MTGETLPAPLPGAEKGDDDDSDNKWEPSSMCEFREVGEKKSTVNNKRNCSGRNHYPKRNAPLVAGEDRNEHTGNDEGSGHSNAVCGCEARRILESNDEAKDGDHQHPIHCGHVDLSAFVGRGMANSHPWEVTKANCLLSHGECTGNNCLRGNDCRRRRQNHHRYLKCVGD